jgi:hypothetical protein
MPPVLSPLVIPEARVFQTGETAGIESQAVQRGFHLRTMVAIVLQVGQPATGERDRGISCDVVPFSAKVEALSSNVMSKIWTTVAMLIPIVTPDHKAALVEEGPLSPKAVCQSCLAPKDISREKYHSCCRACGAVTAFHEVQAIVETRLVSQSCHSGLTVAPEIHRHANEKEQLRQCMTKLRVAVVVQNAVLADFELGAARHKQLRAEGAKVLGAASLALEMLRLWHAEYELTPTGGVRKRFGPFALAYPNRHVERQWPHAVRVGTSAILLSR